MAERRQKTGSVLLRIGSKERKGRIVEIYSAEQFQNAPEADAGLYRVMVNGRWVRVGGQQYTFFTPEALGQLLAQELTAPGALAKLERPAPALSKGQTVRVNMPDYPIHQTKLASDPVLWIDGQWRALISSYYTGTLLVCCNDLTLLDQFGREVPA